MSSNTYDFPSFDDLPHVEGQPQGCLWGCYDNGTRKDELGSLNLLTPEVVTQAATEIRTGIRIQLDWPLNGLRFPGFGRILPGHKVKDHRETIGAYSLDDELHINTQSSSQWDGLKHYGVQKSGLYYNGWTHQDVIDMPHLGTHNICNSGGIVGRGILVDWLSWWESKHPGQDPPPANTTHSIPVNELAAALKCQGTECRQGDILIVRTGFTKWHKQAIHLPFGKESRLHMANPSTVDDATREHALRQRQQIIGVESSERTVRWLYSKHFAAVAGDTMGFEAWPPGKECVLHEWLLAYWGTPIGELWDLEALSEECERQNRWSFFLTSAPLRVEGGVASPPNVIAIL